MGKPLKAIFMGSDAIALPFLRDAHEHLREAVSWVGVFTQPDRRAGRGMKHTPNPIKSWALEEGIPLRQPERCGPEDEAWIADLGADVLVVMAFGQLLRRSLLNRPPLGAVNFHASLLPGLRGASPIVTALAEGHSHTGVSLMKIIPRMDAGPVADVEALPILASDDHASLRQRVADACIPLWRRVLPKLQSGVINYIPQDESRVTYCRRITKEDAWLDFARPAPELARRVRAFQPWPGSTLLHQGVELRLGAAEATDTLARDTSPGSLSFCEDGVPIVTCGSGGLRLLSLQRPGGRMLGASDFLRGYPMQANEVLISRPMASLVSDQPFRQPS